MKYLNNPYCYFSIFYLSFALCFASPAAAEVVELKLDNGHVVSADFSQGEAEAPAILIMHGFLQTREFYTVMRLYNALVDAGYSVLAPTLSLGLNHRRKSLACEAIHTHSMSMDIAEIDRWVRWLKQKTGKDIILLGHSAGSIQGVVYADAYKDAPLQQALFISLSYFGESESARETPADYQRATDMIKQGKSELEKFGLAYCKEYVTTPENYISYYEWGRKKILSTLKLLKIPAHVIYGSKDRRIDADWIKNTRASGVDITVVDGANHFFDSEYEFDLQEVVERLLPAI